jgi:hypothetical protein
VPSLNSTGRLVSDAVARNTAAIIMMGNPRHVDGLVFNVGSAVAGGVSCGFFPFFFVIVYLPADDLGLLVCCSTGRVSVPRV